MQTELLKAGVLTVAEVQSDAWSWRRFCRRRCCSEDLDRQP